MLIAFLKKWIVCLMAFVSVFTAHGGEKWDDTMAGHDFPRIEETAQAAGTTRIMSFNIRCLDVNGVEVKDRLQLVTRQILETMPDSLGIQEATPEWMRHLNNILAATYGWVGVEREEGGDPLKSGESCPIFYLKAKLRLLDSGYFWLSETPEEPSFGPGAACKRICTWAKLRDRMTGETFVHVNTHFDHVSEPARQAGAEIVTAYIDAHFSGVPVVFTADCNTTADSDAYATMTSVLRDASVEAADAKGAALCTYHGANPETHTSGAIDFVLCSPEIRVKTYRNVTAGVDGRFVSDHFPIYADVVIPASADGRRPVC